MLRNRAYRLPRASVESLVSADRTITYSLRFSQRRTIGITVYPDGRVVVLAPANASRRTVRDRVSQRGGWILNQLDRLAKLPAASAPKAYREGEHFRFLGHCYRLQLITRDHSRVFISGKNLRIEMPDIDDVSNVRKNLLAWYRVQAAQTIAQRMAFWAPRTAKLGIPAPNEWRLRRMKRRWGSCSWDGRILFNPELVAADLESIDYVVVHELCHLREHNHSPAFYALLARLLPDWKDRKQRLDTLNDARLD